MKSEAETQIEFRNSIMYRITERKANILYWKKIMEIKKYKTGSAEVMEAIQNVKLNEENIEKDKIFLDCIDEMLRMK